MSRSTHFARTARHRRTPLEEDRVAEAEHRSSCTITSGTPEKKNAGKLTTCVNQVCSYHHFVKDCARTYKELKKSLLENHQAKKTSPGGRISPITGNATEPPALLRLRTSPP